MIPELSLSQDKRVTRQKYIILAETAINEEWYHFPHLEIIEHVPGQWTMAVEVSAQLNRKRIEGSATNYSIGRKLRLNEEQQLDTQKFLEALAWLKENTYVR